MPSIPRLDTPQVRDAALPGVRVSTDAPIEAFGGGASLARVGDAVQNVATAGKQIYDEEKKKADDLATTEAWAKTAQYKNSLMYDPKTGAMTRRGKDAFGVNQEYLPQFDKFTSDTEANLANEDQRAMYRKIALQQKTELSDSLEKHVFTEAKSFDDQTTESGLKVAKDDAVLNYQNPGKVQESVGLQQALIQSHAARNGLPAEWVKQKMDEVASKTHTEVISRMLANDQDQLASSYYKQVKDQVSGEDSVHLEKALEEGSLRGESQRMSDKILSTAPTMTDALAEARKVSDPKLRDKLSERIKDEFTVKQTAQRMDLEKLHQQAGNIIDQTGSIDKIPPADWARFTVAEKESLKTYAKNRLEGIEPPKNGQTYYDLKTLASTPEGRDKFMTENLLSHRNDVHSSELHELIELQTSMRKNDGKADKLLDGFRTKQQIVKEALSASGIDPTPKDGSSGAEKVNAFSKMVDEQIRVRQAQTGKEVSDKDVQDITDNLLIKGITSKGWLWDSHKKAFELNAGEHFEVPASDVPKQERAKIEAALRGRNMPVTDQAVSELYSRKVRGMVPGGQ